MHAACQHHTAQTAPTHPAPHFESRAGSCRWQWRDGAGVHGAQMQIAYYVGAGDSAVQCSSYQPSGTQKAARPRASGRSSGNRGVQVLLERAKSDSNSSLHGKGRHMTSSPTAVHRTGLDTHYFSDLQECTEMQCQQGTAGIWLLDSKARDEEDLSRDFATTSCMDRWRRSVR